MKVCLLMSLVGMLTTGLNGLKVADIIKSCEQDKSKPGRRCFGWSTPEAQRFDACNQKLSDCKYAFASVTKLEDDLDFLVQLAGKAKNGTQAWVGMILFDSTKVLSQDMMKQGNTVTPNFGIVCISDDTVKTRSFSRYESVGVSQKNKIDQNNYGYAVYAYPIELEPGWIVCQFKLDLGRYWVEKEDEERDSYNYRYNKKGKELARRYRPYKVGLVGNSRQGRLVEPYYQDSIIPEYLTSSNYPVDIFTSSAPNDERRGSKFVIRAALVLLALVPAM